MRQKCLAVLAVVPFLCSCAAALAPVVIAGAGVTGLGSAADRDGVAVAIIEQRAQPSPVADELAEVDGTAATTTDFGAWEAFVEYAVEKRTELEGPDVMLSAVLVSPQSSVWPARLPCKARVPAVMLDLDEGANPFDPEPAMQPSPGLVASLARLREAGFVVLWTSSADGNRVTEVGEALRTSGLDPTGRDPLLLVLDANERKQLIRREAVESVCVLAVAGDRRSDFDEAFDYLRVPASEIGLEQLIGDGWFLTPPPLAEARANLTAIRAFRL